MEEKLIAFIKKELINDSKIEFTNETKLVSSGLVDSFSLVALHVFIQKEFGKKIPSSKVTAQSFDTVTKIVELVSQY